MRMSNEIWLHGLQVYLEWGCRQATTPQPATLEPAQAVQGAQAVPVAALNRAPTPAMKHANVAAVPEGGAHKPTHQGATAYQGLCCNMQFAQACPLLCLSCLSAFITATGAGALSACHTANAAHNDCTC